ncbi:rhodanese-like domain-containing protein [Tenacibaculum finnmarkense]|uniref:Rhodanese-like domain-containing protein n=1 Tax=Tenacibaculum finnmarkense genomovar finnmarkense TaxID=1458503 RepID=A0AAP1RDF3_9FLAO|nr:rhodanese-like domain-containing protein [Tenacibaculum finnmarkense]MBE7651558.1 rhodanese-like domain-containing protein [Tenacibaculum finnmarkense genomovar finnmarkense]MBE7694093.1 rhodanese-like domain-containing protein [Tenacibaculum finnmarkense genomovar finnmarkense]MCD8426603.1 rhodanese-like domain-containing protein [Tenacibaculum finnmarkense genomovar finnmarkense]MCG8730395.1 rhodanese-like domain-containing protein [Tenacibaculum finnmarkense]MCG8750825.1 rhodanese-like d
MKKYLVFIALIFTVFTSCKSQENNIKNTTVADLQLLLKTEKKIQLLDVRTPEECSQGIIKDAIMINVFADDFEEIALKKLDKTKPVYVYCRSGRRSVAASVRLKKQGFDVYNILGGYIDYQKFTSTKK